MILAVDKNNTRLIKDNYLLKRKEVEQELESNPFGHYLIMIEEDSIIGYIYYSDIYERAEINQFEIVYLHRHCGKGEQLLKKLIEIVDKSITLEVRENNYPAIGLYTKLGFTKVAIRKNYYNGIDGILMERVK